MKRFMKFFFKTAIVLLLLPLMVLYGLFIYLSYINPDAQKAMKAMTVVLENPEMPDNGFGGAEGIVVLDSGYRSDRYFWIDNQNLLFRKNSSGGAPKEVRRNYIWSIEQNIIKPLDCECYPINIYDNYFYYAKSSKKELVAAGNQKKKDQFQSRLVELEDRWILADIQNVDEVFKAPSERHELAWTVDGKPWFRVPSDQRVAGDTPKHRFKYLWEWGWILRMPRIGPEYWKQSTPEMGFFDLDKSIYFGQKGEKVSGIIDVPAADLLNIELVYIAFLERYWIANRLFHDTAKKKYLGFINLEGKIQRMEWLIDWLEYSGIPLPTRKGLFWSGKDYRKTSPALDDTGAFIVEEMGGIHKIVHGVALREKLSNDGCNVAFFHSPRNDDRNAVTLKVFSACSSTINGKEFQNANY